MTSRRRGGAVVSVFVAVSVLFAPARVGAGTWTGGATEWTQIANNIQLIEHTINLIQMVVRMGRQLKYMAQHAKSIQSPAEFLAVMSGVGGLLSEMRGLLYASQSVVDRWQRTHQGNKDFSQWYASPAEAYEKIDESTRQAVLRAMQTLELQTNSKNGWPKDREILQQLASKARTANGQLKATQVTNDLLLEVIRQLHLLRGVQIAHAEMMGYHISGETQRRQFEDKYLRDRRMGYTGKYRAGGTVNPMTATLGYNGSGASLMSGGRAWQPASGHRAPATSTVGGDDNWQPADGPRAPAPNSVGGDGSWQPSNGPRAPAPGSAGGDDSWQPSNGPRAPEPDGEEAYLWH